MFIGHIRTALDDPALYFACIPERANRELIWNMCTNTHIGVRGWQRLDEVQFQGIKVAYPNDWAKSVTWITKPMYISFKAIGTLVQGGVKYKYSGNHGSIRTGFRIKGVIVFALDGTVLEHASKHHKVAHAYPQQCILEFVAPPNITRRPE